VEKRGLIFSVITFLTRLARVFLLQIGAADEKAAVFRRSSLTMATHLQACR